MPQVLEEIDRWCGDLPDNPTLVEEFDRIEMAMW